MNRTEKLLRRLNRSISPRRKIKRSGIGNNGPFPRTTSCPVAQYLRLNGIKEPCVGPNTVISEDGTIDIPDRLRKLIGEYDKEFFETKNA